jgi:hypothetical protein
MPQSQTKARDTARGCADVCKSIQTTLAHARAFLSYNTAVNVSWTPATKNFTIVNATDVCTSTAHGLANGQKGRLTNSGGALPAGLATDTDYWLVAVAANTFQLSATKGGAAVNATGDGTGTHTFNPVPDYIAEETDGTGNLSGLPYSRVEVSNAIGSIQAFVNLMTNVAPSQGDHIGNTDKLASAPTG